MSKSMLFVGSLRKSQRDRLERAARKTKDARFRDRCRAMLWSSEGERCSQIAQRLSVDPTTVARWMKDYRRFGFAGLKMGKSPGRPPLVDAEARAALVHALDHHPRDLGYELATWTLKALQDYLRKTVHVHVHTETVRKALKKLGYRHKRPKLSLKHRQDPADVKRARRERDAALKKGPPLPTSAPLSTRTSANSISIPA